VLPAAEAVVLRIEAAPARALDAFAEGQGLVPLLQAIPRRAVASASASAVASAGGLPSGILLLPEQHLGIEGAGVKDPLGGALLALGRGRGQGRGQGQGRGRG
jgi:hypothetical protein